MGFPAVLAVLLVLVLSVAVIALLLQALPWILMVVGVGLLLRWYGTRYQKIALLPTNRRLRGRAKPAPVAPSRVVTDVLPQGPAGSTTRRRFLVRFPPDAVHDAIEKSLVTIGAKVRWDRRNPRHAEGAVTEWRLFGTRRYIDVAFGDLASGGCWVSVVSDSAEMQARFQQALDGLVGPTRDLIDESEVSWCRRFNEAMAHQGDPTRVYPDSWICPNCGAAIIGGASCGRCGARVEAAR